MTEAMKKVEAEPCRCVECADCRGRGHYYVDHRGRYLGPNRSDDLDESQHCDGCYGSGIVESCDRCQLLEEMDCADRK